MKGSLHIGTYAGIPVKIHWTFGLLLLYVTFAASKNGFQPFVILITIGFVLSLFFCVILHEFGHALTARRFGVKTFDIMMTPIGGIARLERMPEGRGQEFWVAIAGPVVNFVIVIVIALGFLLLRGETLPLLDPSFWNIEDETQNYFKVLLKANGYLGAFNLIPAFPMDGGRILRSLLSLRMDRSKATQIASIAGQVIALGMFAWGVYTSQAILTLIGVFIFFAARQENKMLQRQALMTRLKASDLMDPVEHIFFTGQRLTDAKQIAQTKKDNNFIVWSRPGIPAGYISRDTLIHSIPSDNLIDAFVIPAPAVVAQDTSAGQLFGFMQHHKIPIALVTSHDQYVGVIPWKKMVDLVRS
jgi:Zn-dependent protease